MWSPAQDVASYSITLGASPSDVLELGLPVLAGLACEDLFPGARPSGRQGPLQLLQLGPWLMGAAVVPVRGTLEETTAGVYGEVLSALGGHHLARCWNYVPDINQLNADGMENYRSFCRARSLTFERWFGPSFTRALPAASAVGGPAAQLGVAFAAVDGTLRHVESPVQVPAYRYPMDYGPRAPSFSRATIATAAGNTVFISGTAAIRGHRTMAPTDHRSQLECTLDNLTEISKACDLGPDLAAGVAKRRTFKVYLRNAETYAETAQALNRSLIRPGDIVSYLHADICRSNLTVEIEATIALD